MDINNRVGIHNRFDIEVIDAKTGEVKQKARAFNVICNALWSRLLTLDGGAGYFNCIHYGSGSGTPAATDTSLFHFEGYKSITADFDSYSTNLNTGVASLRRKVILDENTAIGVNITEVGIAYGANASNLCTHAMLQDMNGNPISIAKTGTDIINIYATVFIHWDNTGDIKITNLNLASYDSRSYVLRIWLFGLASPSTAYYTQIVPKYVAGFKAAFLGSFAARNEAWYSTPRDPSKDVCMFITTTAATPVMDLANKRFSVNFSRIPATNADQLYINEGGVGRLVLFTNSEDEVTSNKGYDINAYGPIVIECGGVTIPPTRIISETIGTGDGTKTKFKTKFDFPYNATVYVNGVAVNSGVTVKRLPNVSQNNFSRYISKLNNQSDANNKIPFAGVTNNSTGRSFAGSSDSYEMYAGNNNVYNIPHEYKCDEIGISKIRVYNNSNDRFYISNDLINWEEITGNGDVELPANKQHFKYFKHVGSGNNYFYVWFNSYDGNNVIFDTPPANGDVITIDYTTPYIPKDENHVLDLSFSITFGEWTGE